MHTIVTEILYSPIIANYGLKMGGYPVGVSNVSPTVRVATSDITEPF